MPGLTLAEGQAGRLSMNWIINKRADLLWFIGGALTGYFMFFPGASGVRGTGDNQRSIIIRFHQFQGTPVWPSTGYSDASLLC
jgi:hypothetical protein